MLGALEKAPPPADPELCAHLGRPVGAAMRLGAAPAAGRRRPGSGDWRSGWFEEAPANWTFGVLSVSQCLLLRVVGGGCVRVFFALAI